MELHRRTPQREHILKCVKNSSMHPTAEVIYDEVKKDMPSISLATVYRNLNTLAKEGDIKKICVGNEARFDGKTNNHQHFICIQCGKIYDKPEEKICELVVKVWEKEGFNVKNNEIICYGRCKDCIQKGEK